MTEAPMTEPWGQDLPGNPKSLDSKKDAVPGRTWIVYGKTSPTRLTRSSPTRSFRPAEWNHGNHMGKTGIRVMNGWHSPSIRGTMR